MKYLALLLYCVSFLSACGGRDPGSNAVELPARGSDLKNKESTDSINNNGIDNGSDPVGTGGEEISVIEGEPFTLTGTWQSECRLVSETGPAQYKQEELKFLGNMIERLDERFQDQNCRIYSHRKRTTQSYEAGSGLINYELTKIEIALFDSSAIETHQTQQAYNQTEWTAGTFYDITGVDFSGSTLAESEFSRFHSYSFVDDVFCHSIVNDENTARTPSTRSTEIDSDAACFRKILQ